MCKRFLKLNLDNDEAEFLALHHPNAFLLLFFIAKRARRTSDQADGLIIGDAIIGSSDFEPGMSRQNFRTALNKLVEFGYVKIVANGKKKLLVRKSTIKLTIKSTVVNITNSTIWDINPETTNQPTNQQLTNSQPTANHKQEGIRKNKKEKEEQPHTPSFSNLQKIKFRELVELTQSEHDSLLAKHGFEFFNKMLDALDSYKGSTGKKYKSDFHTMKQGGWVCERVNKELLKTGTSNEKAFRHTSEVDKHTTNRFQPSRVLRGSNELKGN